MNISLPKALEDYVRAKVESGQYASASEVIRESLRGMQLAESDPPERARLREQVLEEIRRKVAQGERDIAEGRYITGEEFQEHIEKLRREILARQSAARKGDRK